MKDDDMITFVEAMLYAMEGDSPSKAIENQERRGQQSIVKNQRLPKRTNRSTISDEIVFKGVDNNMPYEERSKIIEDNNLTYTRSVYERMGIEIIEEYDDLFWSVRLPEGWEIKATDHSMWNELFDNKGRKRAFFFYKAAFYDRDAFINFDTRFHISVDHIADPGADYEVWSTSDYQGIVKDGNEVIYCTECVPVSGDYLKDNKIKENLHNQLKDFMNEHFPDYENIHAYWD